MPERGPQPSHFSYAAWEAGSDLEQGDLLRPTDDVRRLLSDIHPHFNDPKYSSFIVLTQTCDLARRATRGGICRSNYIGLAVVRPLEAVLCNLLDKVCEPLKPEIYRSADKTRAIELLDRIFNQNEQALGVFYLHPDAAVDISVPSVALLQVAFAFRSEHYATLVAARCGRLNEVFRARLGWLVGNLYSRVAVDDLDPEEREALKNDLLFPKAGRPGIPQWADRGALRRMRAEAGGPIEKLPEEEFRKLLAKFSVPSEKERAIGRIVAVVKSVLADMSDEEMGAIRAGLDGDADFGLAFK